MATIVDKWEGQTYSNMLTMMSRYLKNERRWKVITLCCEPNEQKKWKYKPNLVLNTLYTARGHHTEDGSRV